MLFSDSLVQPVISESGSNWKKTCRIFTCWEE